MQLTRHRHGKRYSHYGDNNEEREIVTVIKTTMVVLQIVQRLKIIIMVSNLLVIICILDIFKLIHLFHQQSHLRLSPSYKTHKSPRMKSEELLESERKEEDRELSLFKCSV